ncbi:MAG: hypothetical protein IT392_02980 [Nitrospirae bacterium]|nr:hypothetical protein [Nitrospirota bacterium]
MGLTFDKSSIEGIYGGTFADGNTVNLLYKGKESFNAIFSSIDQAQTLIALQFYIFRNDETGIELADILKKKAGEGVDVFILFDHFGSWWTPKSFWRDLARAGVQIRASRPFLWTSPFHYTRRDHRKLIIIDGIKAVTGGFNIGNEYRGFHLRLKRKGWRDTGIILDGPVVSELFKTFKRTWEKLGGSPILLPPPLPASQTDTNSQYQYNDTNKSSGLSAIPIFASSAKGRRRFRKLLYYSINHAKDNILITTAYFIPTLRLLYTLEKAVSRGVSVKLLLSGKSDIPPAHYAGRYFFSWLLKRGIRIYNYKGEMLHAKSYVFDGCWSIVGSANLDFLSLRRNDEGNVGILDEEFGSRMICVFEEDMESSVEILEDEWGRRPLKERIMERVFVLFKKKL